MTRTIIKTNQAPVPSGPYNQAIAANGFLFVAGQIALDPATNQPVSTDDVAKQTHQVIANIRAILEASGATLDDIVRTTVFLADMKDYPIVNEIYSSYFSPASSPARVCVQVAKLPMDMLVEIDCIAVLNQS